jgi:drug/metabolite transporter (DMT)-like permease
MRAGRCCQGLAVPRAIGTIFAKGMGKEHIMRNPLGIIIVVAGIVLLGFGINASDSFSSHVSNAVHGTPSDKSMWLIIGGIVTVGLGAAMTWAGSSRPQ